jgi:hypothetical protein
MSEDCYNCDTLRNKEPYMLVRQKSVFGALCVALSLAAPPLALAADVAGAILDQGGQPVAGISISAQEEGAKTSIQANTDAHGHYRIIGLAPGIYAFKLDPGKKGFKAGTAVSYVGGRGLSVDWRVSPGGDAIAAAKEGVQNDFLAADPFGMSMGEFASVVTLGVGVVGAGVVGGYGAAGGFSGPSASPKSGPPVGTSSSM